jgi:hypothetical protein
MAPGHFCVRHFRQDDSEGLYGHGGGDWDSANLCSTFYQSLTCVTRVVINEGSGDSTIRIWHRSTPN